MSQVNTFICTRCTKPFDTVTPQMELITGVTVTMMVWAHPEPQRCPHCNQAYQMKVAKIEGLAIGLFPITTDNDSRIITLPPGTKLQ